MPPFKSGAEWTGNPRGRPRKGTALADHLRVVMAEELPATKRPRQPAESTARRVARALVNAALAGNVSAFKELADRLEGTVPAQLGLSLHAGLDLDRDTLEEVLSAYVAGSATIPSAPPLDDQRDEPLLDDGRRSGRFPPN